MYYFPLLQNVFAIGSVKAFPLSHVLSLQGGSQTPLADRLARQYFLFYPYAAQITLDVNILDELRTQAWLAISIRVLMPIVEKQLKVE